MTRAGELDRRIIFQVNAPTQSGSGAQVDSWSNLATVWARVKPLQEKEEFDFEQSAAFEVLEFKVRYQQRFFNYKLRISYNNKIFDIERIREMGRKQDLLIVGKAHV